MVLVEAGEERTEFSQVGSADLLYPAVEVAAVTFGHELGGLANQAGRRGHLRASSGDLFEVGAPSVGQIGGQGQNPAGDTSG
ncbi:hypothetical protein OHA40_31010 [Nocardia sp. NBC_00508]|uniref:hypothetical protein n=1 Tax=Nocardia sp. NBC_00508 TaxID=2975992 RepID=UPI002E8243F0|nr:hypothetical protein [Nocardia sp. NBC_00508]WUD65961.1 hypothetical protein OHA40_31010 [Nocardia sp. NBC_00508]